MPRAFYDDVSDALTSFLPPSLRDFRSYRTSHNIKVWYGEQTQEHYEVQHVRRRSGHELEIGFHSEHKDRDRNDEVLERLASHERSWRKTLGKEPEAGQFLGGRFPAWRRLSELWPLGEDPEQAVDAAARLADYIKAFEPIRTR